VLLLFAGLTLTALLMAHVLERRRELTLRIAMGATRRQVFSQLVTEGLVITAIAGSTGLLVLYVLQHSLQTLIPDTMPRRTERFVDGTVLLTTLGAIAAIGALASLAPAWTGLKLTCSPRDRERFWSRRHGARQLRNGVLAVQVVVLAVLVSASFLLIRSLWNLEHVALGFNPTDVLSAELQLTSPRYRQAANIRQFEDDLMRELRSPSLSPNDGSTPAP